jgi:hypothetical protein
MERRSIWGSSIAVAHAILLAGWVIGWFLAPELGSPADKDLWAPVFLTCVVLLPLGVVFGALAGHGANGRPQLERFSYVVFAVLTVLIGNAFTYFPDDLFYCDAGGHGACATSVVERVLGLGAMEGALLVQLGVAYLVRSRPRDGRAHSAPDGDRRTTSST